MSAGISATTIAAVVTATAAVGGLAANLASGTPKLPDFSGSAPTANTQSSTDEVSTAASKAQKARTALLETAGGAAGSPLSPGQVSPTQTIFGN